MFNNAVFAFLQLWLATLAFAAPIADEVTVTGAEPWHYGTGGGIIGFIVLVLDILVWIEVLQSNRPVSHKILWCLVVFLFPIVGMIVYYLFSNRKSHMRNSDYTPVP
ncbi:cardiolipin synthase [Fusarium tjaetaba]|uniref:Cardiolipin synthase n=1 Tax=Fusarium tjaetaba TaxID=1567544 RepID=A0A8H5VQP4_9HYPO|nr:cardiolipin synthase [Fusarium tjaetaba]KAF5633842.1 cardiolipin synthase [Fusarium tjaetaba]